MAIRLPEKGVAYGSRKRVWLMARGIRIPEKGVAYGSRKRVWLTARLSTTPSSGSRLSYTIPSFHALTLL